MSYEFQLVPDFQDTTAMDFHKNIAGLGQQGKLKYLEEGSLNHLWKLFHQTEFFINIGHTRLFSGPLYLNLPNDLKQSDQERTWQWGWSSSKVLVSISSDFILLIHRLNNSVFTPLELFVEIRLIVCSMSSPYWPWLWCLKGQFAPF